VTLKEKNASLALRQAKKIGLDSEANYKNDQGQQVHIEFVGVLDFMQMGVESESNEVWYDIRTMLEPMERKDKIIPAEKKLLARVNKSYK